jgi:hypothetical protein
VIKDGGEGTLVFNAPGESGNPEVPSGVWRAMRLEDQRMLWALRGLYSTGSTDGVMTRRLCFIPAARTWKWRPSTFGGVYGINSRTGRLVWRYERRGLTFSGLAADNGRLYGVGSDRALYAFR